MEIIKINYPNGEIEINTLYVIHDMPISDFKIIAKLFAYWNEPREHWEFISMCEDAIKDYKESADVLEKEKNLYRAKADGKEYTVFTKEYCNKLISGVQKQISGLNTKINRCQRKIDIIKSYMC